MRHPPQRYHSSVARRSIAAPVILATVLLAMPLTSDAIQLYWSDGAADLSFSQNTRAVLAVQADSAEVILPPQWRLLWVADSAGILLVAPDSLAACFTDTAKISSFDLPATPADSAAHMITARFCAENLSASSAYYVLDLAGGSHGRLRVVALSPTDSTQVIESNEVTFNGGIDGDYAPLILLASPVHERAQFSVTVEGTGLAATEGLSLVGAAASWRFPLIVDVRSDSLVHASAVLAAPLPACTIEATMVGGVVASTELSADSLPAPEIPQDYCFYFYPGSLDTTHLQPKDFTFVFAHDGWHVFYIRHYQDAPGETTYTRHPEWNERNLGHATSTDLRNWAVQARNVLQVPGTWDSLHVWAPHIVRKTDDITYYMS